MHERDQDYYRVSDRPRFSTKQKLLGSLIALIVIAAGAITFYSMKGGKQVVEEHPVERHDQQVPVPKDWDLITAKTEQTIRLF